MPPTVTLSESIEAILDAMVAAIEAETDPSDTLEEVKEVVRGERARPQPKMPAVWVVPEPARNTQTTQGLAEAWTMAVHIAALVKDDDQVRGQKLASQLAAKARAAVLAPEAGGGRRLGLAYVNDIVSVSFDPFGNRGPENKILHWGDAVVQVRWRTTGGA